MQEHGERAGKRPEHRARRAEGVRALLGVMSLDAAATGLAAPDPDPEPSRGGTARRQVALVLLGRPLELDLSAAVRAAARQRRLELSIDRAPWNHAMTVAAMRVAALSPWPLRLLGRIALGERRCLALARAAEGFEQALELGDAGVTLGDPLLSRGERRPQLGYLRRKRGDGAEQLLPLAHRLVSTVRRHRVPAAPSPLSAATICTRSERSGGGPANQVPPILV